MNPARDAIITSFLRQNDIETSFWRNKDVIIFILCPLGIFEFAFEQYEIIFGH